MPRYRAAADVFVGGSLLRAGDEFTSDQPPGRSWVPIDPPAPAKAAPKPAKANPDQDA
ncbi:MAG: hypothetical protein RLZZ501_157 [Pseudomonadota bacterium]